VERVLLNALATIRLCRLTCAAAGDAFGIVLGEADPPLQKFPATLLFIFSFAFTILILSVFHGVRVLIEILVD